MKTSELQEAVCVVAVYRWKLEAYEWRIDTTKLDILLLALYSLVNIVSEYFVCISCSIK